MYKDKLHAEAHLNEVPGVVRPAQTQTQEKGGGRELGPRRGKLLFSSYGVPVWQKDKGPVMDSGGCRTAP